MSLNHIYDNGIFKPDADWSCNQLLLQQSSNQLIFQNAETGNKMSLNVAQPGQNTVLSIPDPGVAAANIALSLGSYKLVSSNVTLTNANSGQTIFLGAISATTTILLPAPTTPGLKFKFVLAGVITSPGTYVITSTAANIYGILSSCNGSAYSTYNFGPDTSLTVANGSTVSYVGDNYEFVSNGTSYFVQVISAKNASVSVS